MLEIIGYATLFLGISGFAYLRYRKNKNREQVRNILHKYMVLNDNDLENGDNSENTEFGFNKFVDTEVDL